MVSSGQQLHSLGRVEVEDVLRFQHARLITNLYKFFLDLIENLEVEHDDAMEKLHKALPAQYKDYVNLANYWTDIRHDTIRKHILDKGNDTIRALDEQLTNYDLSIKNGKGTIT